MHMTPIIILGLALAAYAFSCGPSRNKPSSAEPLTGRQKLLRVLAVLLMILIALNPESLALGLLGDTAFFDLLVLLIGIQLQTVAAQAWGWIVAGFSLIVPRFTIPHLRMSYCMFLLIFAPIVTALVTVQKAVHRMTS